MLIKDAIHPNHHRSWDPHHVQRRFFALQRGFPVPAFASLPPQAELRWAHVP